MNVIRAVLALLAKTFAADLVMTLTALTAVGLTAMAVHSQALTAQTAPYALAAGVLAALTIGVVRGDKT